MLSLLSTPHRPLYHTLPSPQQAYILLEVLPDEETPRLAAPGSAGLASGKLKRGFGVQSFQSLNFCLVLDRSGSMAGEKLRAMKEAGGMVVDRLGPGDLLSVVIFDDADPAELVVPAGPVVDREALKRRIAAIEERGGTHMSTGMRLGLQQLERGRTPERVSQMLLLTDGQTWEDQDTCRELADRCREAGIPIYVCGLGIGADNNWDPVLLEDLALRSGGEWTAIETPDQVSAVFGLVLQAAKETAATNASLTLRLIQGVTPRAVWRITPLISRLDHQAVGLHDIQVYLGDIRSGEGQALLLDLLLPVRPAGSFRMAQADLRFDLPSQGLSGQRAAADVVLRFEDGQALADEFNQPMMNLIERVVAHRLQTQALDEAAAGNAARATQKLRAAATRLLELGETDLAQQASQQANQLEQGGGIDLASAQKMRYATRRLTEFDR
jgi:Ca-activated chloride channel homolog